MGHCGTSGLYRCVDRLHLVHLFQLHGGGNSLYRLYSRHPLRHITVPMLGGVLTALTDETIQLFSEGRSSQVTDVWLDSAGVLAGILVAIVLLLACEGLYYHIKRRHE